MDSRYILEVNLGLRDGFDVGLKVREVSGIIHGSACLVAWIMSFTGMRKAKGGEEH